MKLNTKTANTSSTRLFSTLAIAVAFSLCNFMRGAFDDDIDDDDDNGEDDDDDDDGDDNGDYNDGDDNGDDDDDLNGLPLSMYLCVKRVWDSH